MALETCPPTASPEVISEPADPIDLSATAAQARAANDAAAQAFGFVTRTVILAGGDEVGYLERPVDDAKQTLLVLHGLTQSALGFVSWVAVLGPLSGVRVLVFDALGHASRQPAALLLGDDLKGWSASERATDAMHFLDAVGCTSPVYVYGFSMGGATALGLAAEYPDRVAKLCLLAPACAFTSTLYRETLSGNVRFAYRSMEETVTFLETVGFPSAAAGAAAPLVAHQRLESTPDDVCTKYWKQLWLGLVGDDEGEDTALARTREQAAKVAAAGKQVLVIQGSADAVINSAVPEAIQMAMGKELCDVVILQDWGHVGCPADAAQGIISAVAGGVAANFLGQCAA